MDPIALTRILAEPDLDQCPIGFLFRGKNPDWSAEERCFAGLEAPLNHRHWSPETYLYLIEDEEGRALENVAKSESLIITQDRHLGDCRVEARVRQFIPGALPNMDDEYCTVARNGLIFRLQDLRRYYQFCLEGYDRAVLYRRCDYERVVLGERRFPLDPRRYHHLVAQAQGDRLCCWCDGMLVAQVRDRSYAEGAAGIRMNSVCRFQGIRIGTWEEGQAAYVSRMSQREKKQREMRETVPRPALWRRYSNPRLSDGRPHFFRPRDTGPACLLVASNRETFKGYTLYDLNGELLWETPASAEGPGQFKFADMDGDGIKEIVSLWDGGFAIHRSDTGQQLAWAPWPKAGPFDRSQERAHITHLYPAHLEGKAHCDSVVLKDDGSAGGWTFWVLGADLSPKWNRTVQLPPMGHNINLYDVDNDGCEEILAGYHCYKGDGTRLWMVEEARYWDVMNGARHPDSLIAGPLWPGSVRAAYASGGEGFVLVDAANGQVLARRGVGHVQGVMVGKFAKEVPGHQIMVGTRHQNYGILCCFDGEGQLLGRFQPDYLSQGGTVVNWTGDGEEHLLLSSSNPVLGLWDYRGNHLLDLRDLDLFGAMPPSERNPGVCYPVDVCGDPRDELILQWRGELYVYTQEQPFAGPRLYAPRRNERIMYPAISTEGWRDNP